jgi:hypothetical protein
MAHAAFELDKDTLLARATAIATPAATASAAPKWPHKCISQPEQGVRGAATTSSRATWFAPDSVDEGQHWRCSLMPARPPALAPSETSSQSYSSYAARKVEQRQRRQQGTHARTRTVRRTTSSWELWNATRLKAPPCESSCRHTSPATNWNRCVTTRTLRSSDGSSITQARGVVLILGPE